MHHSLGEKPRRRQVLHGPKQLRPVPLGPQVEPAGALEAIGEDLDLLVGGDGEEAGRPLDGLPGTLEVGDGGLELGALAHLVDLALAGEAGLEELLGFLGLHALPLPLGDAAGEGSGAAAHADEGGLLGGGFEKEEGWVEEERGG